MVHGSDKEKITAESHVSVRGAMAPYMAQVCSTQAVPQESAPLHSGSRVCLMNVVWGPAFSLVSGSLEPSGEGDRERVQRGLPPHHPACPPAAGRVKRPRHQIQALQRGLLVREVPARPDGPAVAGVDRLDRVGRADHPPDLDVVFEERHELRPRVPPQLHDRRISSAPRGGELLEPVLRRLLGRGRIDRLQ